jgi:fibronectin type 3 domain-containing protein
MLLRSLLILLACLSLAFTPTPAQAAQVQLAWDAPLQANGTPVPNLAGYKLYYGSQSGQYQTAIPVGMTTTYTVTNISAGQTYYFAATAYDTAGTESAFSNEVSVTPGTIPQQQMRVVSVDSQDVVGGNYAATNALDGNPATFWHTEWYQQTTPLPHTLVLDLGGQYQVDGFRYLPRQDGNSNGTIADYQFYVSLDGTTWGTAVAAGTLAADTSEKTVRFTAKTGRYVRLVALSEMNSYAYTNAAELNIFGTIVTLPSVTLSAAPASIASGQTATLTWSATNTTACSAAWTTSTATAGSQTVQPTSTTTYTLNCTGAGGTASASTTVSINTPVGSLIPQQQFRVVSVDRACRRIPMSVVEPV